MTNACALNCHYCPMRRDRAMRRTLLKPEELVRIFLGALRRGWCEGLFITTGIPARPEKVTDDLIAVLEMLRVRHRFAGYIHVKLVPGADQAQIERITALATRVSVNLEAACGDTLLQARAGEGAVEHPRDARARASRGRCESGGGTCRSSSRWSPAGWRGGHDDAVRRRRDARFRPDDHGPCDEPLCRGRDPPCALQRVPARSATRRWKSAPAAPVLREHRLYQVDWLVRDYGFAPNEVVYEDNGNLPLAMDPKAAWALAHPECFPVDVSSASYERLVRVPGVGPRSARRIVDERRSQR